MNDRVLFVDDEPHILEGYQRALRRSFKIETAGGGEEGLHKLDCLGPYAVVVSDLRMPGTDGVQFLTAAHERHPETVRVLLTGDADLRHAIEAVNRGSLFRFLTKPCTPDVLVATLTGAVEQHRLVTLEKELLDRTVRGAVRVLGDVLGLVNPAAFGRADRARHLIAELAAHVPGAGGWEIDVAATLSHLGCVVVPEKVLAAAEKGTPLAPAERKMLLDHPLVARDLLTPIPRMERVAEIIAYQRQRFDGTNQDAPGAQGTALPLGSRLLKLALDFEELLGRGRTKPQAVHDLQSRPGEYDPSLLAVLAEHVRRDFPPERRDVRANDLVPGMIVADDLLSDAGSLLLRRGTVLTGPVILRLKNQFAHGSLSKPLPVLIPADLPISHGVP